MPAVLVQYHEGRADCLEQSGHQHTEQLRSSQWQEEEAPAPAPDANRGS